ALTQGAGIGRYTRELVREVVATNQNDTFALFSARQPAELPVPEPIPVAPNVSYHEAPISERWLYRLWYRLQLPVRVEWFTGRLDLFHSPDFVLPPVNDAIPTLLTVHDLSYLHFPETFTPALVNYLNKVVPRSVGRASHILADSEATRRDIVERYNVPVERITVLYSGVGERFKPVNNEARLRRVREKYGIGKRPYILSVSTLQPRKNYEMLIRAFKDIAATRPHNLVIAGGKGWLYERVTEEIRLQGLNDRVLLIGFADDEDLPALYSGASLFAYPSLYEGFGLPLLEAMACGVPVLNSNASCLPEVAGKATRQLPPDDQAAWTQAMNSLLADSGQRSRMVAAGFLQARKFTWTRAAQALNEIYHRLLSEK
ncbi:MAG: glycosyltransferase family 1 protein, partial [Chloroflexota bacterium]